METMEAIEQGREFTALNPEKDITPESLNAIIREAATQSGGVNRLTMCIVLAYRLGIAQGRS